MEYLLLLLEVDIMILRPYVGMADLLREDMAEEVHLPVIVHRLDIDLLLVTVHRLDILTDLLLGIVVLWLMEVPVDLAQQEM